MNHDDIEFEHTEFEPTERRATPPQHNSTGATWATQLNITVRVLALLALVGFIFWLLLGQR